MPAPPDLGLAPVVEGIDGWLNTSATDFAAFEGTVRVVQFCSRLGVTLPYLQELYRT